MWGYCRLLYPEFLQKTRADEEDGLRDGAADDVVEDGWRTPEGMVNLSLKGRVL